MALTYTGVTAWAQSAPEEWHLSDFGLDTVTVPYSGAEPQRAAFAASLNRWDPWSGDTNMLLTGWSNSGRKTYPQIDVRYIGCKGGILPPSRWSNTFCVQTVSTTGTDTATDEKVSGEFMFRAPTTTWHWIQNFVPGDNPLHAGLTTSLSPLNTLFRAHVTVADPDVPGMVPYSSYIAVFNSLAVVELLSEYHTEEIVPGRYWSCSSSTQRTLLGN